MSSRTIVTSVALAAIFIVSPSAQAPNKVDFARDVQPLLRQYCVGCHGPAQQMSGFRLDRRRDAFRGGTSVDIGPGNSEGSKLFQRLIGSDYGQQMPPTGALAPDKIAVIKAWIDQGAEWPDDVSGEMPPMPPDPGALKLIAAIHRRDTAEIRALVATNPSAVNRRGAAGWTPLMEATLNSDKDMVGRLLDASADSNLRDDAGATALMWAAGDVDKARLLLDHGADPNAKSADARTPVMIAAGFRGSRAAVALLLDRGADPSAMAPDGSTPLSEAAYAGDAAVFHLLLQRGAKAQAAGVLALYLATTFGCEPCVVDLVPAFDRTLLTGAMAELAPPDGDGRTIRWFLDRGADAIGPRDAKIPMLVRASSSDLMLVDAVRALIKRGADVNATMSDGTTALGLARLRGDKRVVQLLLAAGARDSARPPEPPSPHPAETIKVALSRTLRLVQQSDVTFLRKTGCVSCHNNSLTAMAVSTARRKGFAIDEQIAHQQEMKIIAFLESWRERVLQNVGVPGDSDGASYFLLGLAAERHPPDEVTDAVARFLKTRQSADGRWHVVAHRPPLESSDIEVTAASMRALQVYAPDGHQTEYRPSIAAAAAWLAQARARTTEDRAFQLLGLAWAGRDAITLRRYARALLAEQRPDGGWAQLPSIASDAYATGQVLVALAESGSVASRDRAYARGVKFLLNTQLEDGSWFVRTRAVPIQPHYESGFPHGRNQFISAAGTNWAAMALALGAE
jgi:ankyrin repeat protein